MIVQDLGELVGPVIVFGGPYSNLHALDALLDVAERMGVAPASLISTGDLVAYCADGEACVQRIRDLGIAVVAGNCERQLAQAADDCGCGFEEGSTCDALSAGWYAHARATISEASRDWMGQLPDAIRFHHSGQRFGVLHGGLSDISRFLWSVSPEVDFTQEITAFERLAGPVDHIFAGHSGIAFERMVNRHRWVNAGTIGMPQNDGQTSTYFAVLDDTGVRFEPLNYDFEGAAEAMEAAGLVQGYHLGLRQGFWPSEDVLPATLRR